MGIVEKAGFEVLAITGHHTEQIGTLPQHHRDPFDRMLVVQAQVEGLTIITADAQVRQYGAPTINARE